MSYPKTPRNAVNRLRNRAKYDYETVHSIVNNTAVLHVSFTPDPDDPVPVVLPMIGAMGTFGADCALSDPLDLYLHGSISSRIMRLAQDAVDRGEEGLAVCVAATKVDGYVLALTPFHHSYNFRSAVLHGHAQLVDDEAEKMYALQLITKKVVPRRWEHTRTPPSKVELQATRIMRVRVYAGSAKVRWGVPNSDRADLKDDKVLDECWAGVVPMWEAFGDPIDAEYNRAAVPAHVREFVATMNDQNRDVAMLASKDQER